MLLDYCLMSALLLLGHLLRSQVGLLQRIYLPTPIIAGLVALLGGDQFLGFLPFARAEDGSVSLAAYPSVLVTLLFATLFLGGKKKTSSAPAVMRRAGDTFFYNLASELGQYAVALLFGLLILAPLFPQVHPGFSLLLPAGFVGGHGTVTAMSEVFEEHGWKDAATIGYTFATFGMLSGIVGGMLMINLATRWGWTRLVKTADELPESLRKGFVPDRERTPIGHETVSPIALDPLTWHIALVLAAFGVAYLVDMQIRSTFGSQFAMPRFALALLAGAVLQKSLDLLGLGGYVDRPVMERIGSTASDYLVAFGVASIKVVVVLENAVPLAILCGLGVAYSAALLWFLGPRMFHNYWFERSIFVYGWNTGVVGIGITLLRVVDPRLRSKTLEDFGLAYVAISFIAIAIIVTLPQLVVRGYLLAPAAVLGLGFIVCLLLSRFLLGWSDARRDQPRSSEQDA